MDIEIVVVPLGRGRFKVWLAGRGVLIKSSRQPLLDAARVLLAEGGDPGTRIAMRYAGSPHIALSAAIGVAAKLEVRDDDDGTRFAPFRDHGQDRGNGSPVRFGEGEVSDIGGEVGALSEGVP